MPLELTSDEIKNGWTEESLSRYVGERTKAQDGIIAFDPQFREPKRPSVANSKYSPFRWRS